jgi:cytochrome c oxidase cbb3-type subunit 3
MTTLDPANGQAKPAAPKTDAAYDDDGPVDEDMLLDHQYDGIQEYDNPMPGWWKALFWMSIAFSACYVFWYHVSGHGSSAAEEFAEDVARANAAAAAVAMKESVSEPALEKLMADAAMMQVAAQLFDQKCKQCHAEQGQGNIGPNLTDDHWIHGRGTLMDIHSTVSQGVLLKGMPAWSKQLTPAELKQLVAFVGTLRGRNVPGKAPEGTQVP